MSAVMIGLFLNACLQTMIMVLIAGFGSVLLGVPLGVVLLITRPHHLLPNRSINRTLSLITNAVRSIPFIILMVAIIPLTRLIVGTSIGTAAASVPLTLAAIPFVARLVETAMEQVPWGLVEAAQSMGGRSQADYWQGVIIRIFTYHSARNYFNINCFDWLFGNGRRYWRRRVRRFSDPLWLSTV